MSREYFFCWGGLFDVGPALGVDRDFSRLADAILCDPDFCPNDSTATEFIRPQQSNMKFLIQQFSPGL